MPTSYNRDLIREVLENIILYREANRGLSGIQAFIQAAMGAAENDEVKLRDLLLLTEGKLEFIRFGMREELQRDAALEVLEDLRRTLLRVTGE